MFPAAWSQILLTMLHNKGDKSSPANYRSIALLTTLFELFTSVILNRLLVYSDDEDIIPKYQNGFRTGRGCMDNIFVLNSVIQIHLRLNGRKVFVAFIDFKHAFDSINHYLL